MVGTSGRCRTSSTRWTLPLGSFTREAAIMKTIRIQKSGRRLAESQPLDLRTPSGRQLSF